VAKMQGAIQHPVRNYTTGGQDEVRGLVIHIMDGTLEGSQSWFNNANSQASSHFGVGKDGELRQWVDTKDRAWAQSNGNRTYLSSENEGRGGDSLTAQQIESNAQVFAWVHAIYGVPLVLAAKAGDKGLAYHALGGKDWGGHTNCPGSKIVAQLPQIVKRAKEIVGIKDDPKPKPTTKYEPFPGVAFFKKKPNSKIVTAMGKRIVANGYKGYKVGPGPQWTDADKAAYAWYQRHLGYSGSDADGWPGKTSWDKLKVPKQ
jgi:hypothetical protein